MTRDTAPHSGELFPSLDASVAAPAVCFAEIRQIIAHLAQPSPVSLPGLPPCGRLADWIHWLARAQGRSPTLSHMRLALFAGAHGCAEDSTVATRQQFSLLADAAGSPVSRVLGLADADCQIYELDLETPTADFRTGKPALDEAAAAHAMAYGMMAVSPGLHLLGLAGFGEGSSLAVRALRDALPVSHTPLETLSYFGGRETCALLGAILAARLANVPVLLDGECAHAAAEVLARLSPDSVCHCASAQAMEKDVTMHGLAAAFCFPRLKSLAAIIPTAL